MLSCSLSLYWEVMQGDVLTQINIVPRHNSVTETVTGVFGDDINKDQGDTLSELKI